MNQAERGWLAGIIDGEGSIVLDPQGREWRRPALSITSTDREILEEVERLIGGTIIPIKAYKNRMKPAWIWRLQGAQKVLKSLRSVQELLKCPKKQKRAAFLLAKYDAVTKRNGQYSEEEKRQKRVFEEEFFIL